MPHRRLQTAIQTYARAYAEIEHFQALGVMPIGDQKTGCIGEYYTCEFLRHKFAPKRLEFARASQKAWDIVMVDPSDTVTKVQTKTVSAFSRTKRLSPIHPGFDWLVVLHLDVLLVPDGFWIIEGNIFPPQVDCLKNLCCPTPGTARNGSSRLDFGPNRAEELQQALAHLVGR